MRGVRAAKAIPQLVAGAEVPCETEGLSIHRYAAVVNGNFLLTSNLSAEKHVRLSIGQSEIQYSVPVPAIRKSCTQALQKSPFRNVIMPETFVLLFPTLHEPLKDGSGSCIVAFPTIIC